MEKLTLILVMIYLIHDTYMNMCNINNTIIKKKILKIVVQTVFKEIKKQRSYFTEQTYDKH